MCNLKYVLLCSLPPPPLPSLCPPGQAYQQSSPPSSPSSLGSRKSSMCSINSINSSSSGSSHSPSHTIHKHHHHHHAYAQVAHAGHLSRPFALCPLLTSVCVFCVSAFPCPLQFHFVYMCFCPLFVNTASFQKVNKTHSLLKKVMYAVVNSVS